MKAQAFFYFLTKTENLKKAEHCLIENRVGECQSRIQNKIDV